MLLLIEAEVEPEIPNVIESFEPNGSPKPLKILLNIFNWKYFNLIYISSKKMGKQNFKNDSHMEYKDSNRIHL